MSASCFPLEPGWCSGCMCLLRGRMLSQGRGALPWGGCSPVGGMLSRGETLTCGRDAHLENHQCCQPMSQQGHVAPSISKHQPHFRSHTHPWHREIALVSTPGGMKTKGKMRSPLVSLLQAISHVSGGSKPLPTQPYTCGF